MNKLIVFNNITILTCMSSIVVLTLIPLKYTDCRTLVNQCINSNQYLLFGIIGSSIMTMTNELLRLNKEV